MQGHQLLQTHTIDRKQNNKVNAFAHNRGRIYNGEKSIRNNKGEENGYYKQEINKNTDMDSSQATNI